MAVIGNDLSEVEKLIRLAKPKNKILKVLILGGGPIGLFAGYKLLKNGHDITIFEKRKKYTRHNILSLHETTKMDTLSLIPSEIMDELKSASSFSHITTIIENGDKQICKNLLKEKPYLMVSSRAYYIVLNELENAYEKYFKLLGGNLIRPENTESYSDIAIKDNILSYHENEIINKININDYDIVFLNDGANSYYRNVYFEKTSYTENIEKNILRIGLTPDRSNIKVANDVREVEPLSYGMIFIHDIQNKDDFLEKFKSIEKLKKKIDFDSVLEFHGFDNDFLKSLSVKEIKVQNSLKDPRQIASQNLFRMFVSENYLYISFMVNPTDAGDFVSKNQNQNLNYDSIPANIQKYIMFALYYYDLTEFIDPRSINNTIKMFPLIFSTVKQSCTFIKKQKKNDLDIIKSRLSLRDSFYGNFMVESAAENCDLTKIYKNNYQLVVLCGDAMSSGNFHSGIVLNKNLIAVNNICHHINEYIDSYPKDTSGELNNNFLRLMFFHSNLSNQKMRNEIINDSVDALVILNYWNQILWNLISVRSSLI